MKWLNKIGVLLVCTLSLAGCKSELTVPTQTPNMKECVGKTPEQVYQEAEEALFSKKYNVAIGKFKAVMTLSSEDNEKTESAHILLIYCYGTLGQFEDAFREVESFQSKYPARYRDSLKMKATVIEMQQETLAKEESDIKLQSAREHLNRKIEEKTLEREKSYLKFESEFQKFAHKESEKQ